MNKERVIIFCQAAADIIYTLDLIEKNEDKKIVIFVCNVESIFTFFKSINIDGELHFLNKINVNFYSFKSILKAKKNINLLFTRFPVFNTYGNKIYFFSTSYDFLTATIVKRLSKNNQVIYYNHYDHLTWLQADYSFSLKRKISSFIYYFITGVNFSNKKIVNFPKFEYQKYDITKIDVELKPDINPKYLISPSFSYKPSILLFLSPEEYISLSKESKSKLIALLEKLKKKYIIYFKGHPRLGEPKTILKFIDVKLDKELPSELIDYSFFKVVLGLTSAALCYPASKELTKVISLLDYLDLTDSNRKNGFKKYINSYSNNLITYELNPILF